MTTAKTGLLIGEDGKARCAWCGNDPLYIHYHDTEWGQETRDDRSLFEKMCLEGFQAGLSWITILRKRENFRAAFANFDYKTLAGFGEVDILELLQNEAIIRHRGKIEAVINNAKLIPYLLQEHGTLWAYFQQYQPKKEARPSVITYDYVSKLDQTAESQALAKDLKKRGFKFLGPTTLYAHMQAMGLVNDHIHGCHAR